MKSFKLNTSKKENTISLFVVIVLGVFFVITNYSGTSNNTNEVKGISHQSGTKETTIDECMRLSEIERISLEVRACFDNLSSDEFLTLYGSDNEASKLYADVFNYYDNRTEEEKVQEAKEIEEFLNQLDL